MTSTWRTTTGTFVVLATLLLGACAGPSVRYEKLTASAVRLLETDQVVFGLRGTDITVLSKDADDAACKKQIDPSLEDWSRCLDGVVVLLTPSVASDKLYLATSHVDNHFQKLHLYATPLNDQSGNVSDIAFTFSDTKAQAIGSIGAGAVAGAAFGPAGSVIGGLIAFAGAMAPSADRWAAKSLIPGPKPSRPLLPGNVCEGDSASAPPLATIEMRSFVPYVFSLDRAMQSTPCWHTVPLANRGSGHGDTAWSGWIYQLRLIDLEPKSYDDAPSWDKENPSHNESPSPNAAGRWSPDGSSDSFPYVPCQEAELRLSWATELANREDRIAYRSIHLLVANPAYVRYLKIPKVGTLKLGAVCNASMVPGVFTGSTPQATTDAVLKAVSDIKAATAKP